MIHPAIGGVAAIPVQRHLPKPIRDVCTDVAFEAIADAGLSPKDVDGLFVSPPVLSGPAGFMWSCSLAHHLGLSTRAQALVECGGITASIAMKLAVAEVRSGRCRAVLALTSDVHSLASATDVIGEDPGELQHLLRRGANGGINLYGPYDGVYGLLDPIPYYAMGAQRYMHEYGATREDLAQVAVALRRNAGANERAQYRKPITVEEVLAARIVCPPLGLLDCSPFASGAAAVLVVEESLARASRKRTVRVRAIGEAHEPAHFAPLRQPMTRFDSAIKAASEAYQSAKVEPSDIDVAEVYGVFSATELMLYEDLGFFDKGKAAHAVREGKTSGGGTTVFNPSGGRLSLGHPAGATPMYSLVEVVEQLRGQCGARQVRDAGVGLVHAEHGMANGSMVAILEAA
jgi:acetyl-CoA C-acetyltransferase